MTRSEMDKIVQEGVCSMESIEASKRLSEELERGENYGRIIDAEQILKALADRNRIKILMLLSHGEMCVCQITSVTDVPQPTISNSLRVLENAHIIRREQRGKWHFYSLAENRIAATLMEILENGS